MNDAENISLLLPTAREIAQAIDIFLELAYDGRPTQPAERFRIPPDCDATAWLMGGPAERSPDNAPLEQVRSFALRIGNNKYPHMKLKLSRPPNDSVFVFTVDAHDEMLRAAPGTDDYDALEELKRHNAQVVRAITDAWGQARLLTEHRYLRRKIHLRADRD